MNVRRKRHWSRNVWRSKLSLHDAALARRRLMMMMHEKTAVRKASAGVTSAAYFGLHTAHRWQATEDGVLTLAGGGSVWITRDNDPADHVLAPGERMVLRRGDALIAEPLRAGEQAWLDWQASAAQDAQPRLVRGALGLFAAGLLALARSAEAMARRAQGSMAPGASMASSGALK
jgi:Protein of unknown function (DUF2917)